MNLEDHLRAVECECGDGKHTRAAVEWAMQELLELGIAKSPPECMENDSRKRPRISAQNALEAEEIVELVDREVLGQHFSAQVDALMNNAESAGLVRLIDHCILMSLGQERPRDELSPNDGEADAMDVDDHVVNTRGDGECAGTSQDHVDSTEDNHYHADSTVQHGDLWLVKTVVTKVLYQTFSRLDWLLAYLTAARPEILVAVIFDELSAALRSQAAPSSHSFLRVAGVLEFSALRNAELVSVAALPLIPPARFSSGIHGENSAYYSYAWLVQCCFSPRFFSCIAKAWAPFFKVEPLVTVWELLESVKVHIPLPARWASPLVAGLSDPRAWIYTLVTKHIKVIPELVADIVILADSSGAISLVEWFKQELSAVVVAQITGSQKNEQNQAMLSSLQHNIFRICETYLAQEHNCGLLLQTFQIVLLGCEDKAVANVFVHATILDDLTSGSRLQVVASCMRSFGILQRDKTIFQLWAQEIANLLHIAESEKVLSRLLAVRQLVDPLFWDNGQTNDFSWKRSLRSICTALDVHWLRFFALLHRTGDDDLLLNTLGLLKTLTIESGLPVREVEPRMKSAVGIFFYWVADHQASSNICNHMRALTLLKGIISHLAAASVSSFTMLATFLIDSAQRVPDLACTSVLSSGSSKVDRYGKVSFPPGSVSGCTTIVSKPSALLEYRSLLMQSMKISIKAMQSRPEDWPTHPAEILGQLLSYRLETPHELSVTMEQYEEVLPKHVSFVRHNFLVECVGKNTFLFKVLQLVTEQAGQLQICAELVRALLAESIIKWQGQHTPVHDSGADRMQLFDIIQLSVSAGWLPHPVSSCGEIISLINLEDIPTLLLIVWRCMHDAMVAGPRTTSSAAAAATTTTGTTAAAPENQAAAANVKEGSTFTDWELQFLSILRRNVSRIGVHIARLYPQQQP